MKPDSSEAQSSGHLAVDAPDPAMRVVELLSSAMSLSSSSKDNTPTANESIPRLVSYRRVQLAFGILALLEEEDNCKLQDLLRDAETMNILLHMVGVPVASAPGNSDQERMDFYVQRLSQLLDKDPDAFSELSLRLVKDQHEICHDTMNELINTLNSFQSSEKPVGHQNRRIEENDIMDQLHHSIESLPEGDKAAFLEAFAVAPHLIRSESNPVTFLRFEEGDVEKAGLRLSRYWKERKNLFGDRAFLPLDLTGQGALTEEDIQVVVSGAFAPLLDDSEGRPVLCLSTALMLNDSTQCRFQARFYVINRMIIENQEVCASKGVVMIKILDWEKQDFNAPSVKGFRAVVEGMPFRIHSSHICCLSSSSQHHMSRTALPLILGSLGRDVAQKAHIHFTDNPVKMIQKLQVFGLDSEGLPCTIGGSWSLHNFDRWYERQKKLSLIQGIEAMNSCTLQKVAEKLVAYSRNAVSHSPPRAYIHPKVQAALGLLSILEQEKRCSLRQLLEDDETETLMRELVGAPVTLPLVERTPENLRRCLLKGNRNDRIESSQQLMLDVIADRVVNNLDSNHELRHRVEEAQVTGQAPESSVGDLLDTLMSSLQ